MFSTSNIIKGSLLNQILSASYTDKRLSKSVILTLSFNLMFQEIYSVQLSIKIQGHLLLGMVKIYKRKSKYLLDDCNEIFAMFRINKPKKRVDRNNMLQIEYFRENMVDDQPVDFESSVLDETFIESEQFMQSVMDFDYNDIEVERNEADFTNDFIMNGNVSVHERKRRRIIDSEIEYSSQVFRNKIRGNITPKKTQINDQKVLPGVMLPNEILNFLNTNMRRESIEVGRDDADMDFFEPAISEITMQNDEPFFNDNIESLTDSNGAEESVLFLNNLEENFVFRDVVNNYSKKEKAAAFLNILNMCTKQEICVNQNSKYGDIFCRKNIV